MEDINHCKRCGKNLNTKNRHSITFMAYTVTPEMYYVCDSCYNTPRNKFLQKRFNINTTNDKTYAEQIWEKQNCDLGKKEKK